MAKSIKVVRPSKLVLWNAIVTKTHRAMRKVMKENSHYTNEHMVALRVIEALYQAEGNANDTMNDAIHGGATYDDAEYEEEFASISYGSLSLTGPFDDSKEVRAFFVSIGYSW